MFSMAPANGLFTWERECEERESMWKANGTGVQLSQKGLLQRLLNGGPHISELVSQGVLFIYSIAPFAI